MNEAVEQVVERVEVGGGPVAELTGEEVFVSPLEALHDASTPLGHAHQPAPLVAGNRDPLDTLLSLEHLELA